jgi:hypothetical protein
VDYFLLLYGTDNSLPAITQDGVRKRLAVEEATQMATGTAYVLHEEVSASQLVIMGLDFEEQQYVTHFLTLSMLMTHYSDVNSPSTSALWVHIQLMNRRQGYNTELMFYDERFHLGSACSTFMFSACMSSVIGMITVLPPINQKSRCPMLNSTYHLVLTRPLKSHVILDCAG